MKGPLKKPNEKFLNLLRKNASHTFGLNKKN